MNAETKEKIRNVFRTLFHAVSAVCTAICGYLLIRRWHVSDNGRGTDSVGNELDNAGTGIERAETAGTEIADLIAGAEADIIKLGAEQSESSATAGTIADSIDRQSGLIEDSKRILESVRKRHQETEN